MKAEDLIPAGDRAKKSLRVAQALATLSTKGRQPALSTVKEALTKVHGPQPAVAMAIILQYAKRHPLHERGKWLIAAGEALQEYRLSEYADQKEAELAYEQIEHQTALHKAELSRIDKMRERFSLALLCLLVSLMLTGLAYFGYTVFQSINSASKEPEKHTAVENSSDKKTDSKPAAAKTPPAPTKAEPKPAEPDKKTAQPAKK